MAAFAKKAARDEAGGDTKMQKLLKALEPREVEEVQLSPEDQAEAERRWAEGRESEGCHMLLLEPVCNSASSCGLGCISE